MLFHKPPLAEPAKTTFGSSGLIAKARVLPPILVGPIASQFIDTFDFALAISASLKA